MTHYQRLLVCFISFYTSLSHAESELFPGFFTARAPDTKVMSFYQYKRYYAGYYVDGKQKADGKITADATVLSYSYFFNIGTYTSSVSFVAPYISAKQTSGVFPRGFGSETKGLGDSHIINKFWPINTPNYSLAIANTLFFPNGKNNHNQALNAGENRWRDSIQVAWTQTLNKSLKLELIPEILFYGTNKNFVGLEMKQDPTYTLTSFLRWRASPILEAQVGAQYNFGGERSYNGIKQDNQENNHRWMMGLSTGLSKNIAINFRYTRNLSVKSRLKIDSDFVLSMHYFF